MTQASQQKPSARSSNTPLISKVAQKWLAAIDVERSQLDHLITVPDWAEPLLAKSNYKAAYGGRSGGKSHFFAEQIVKRFIENPDLRVVCIREVQKSLKYSAKSLIEDKIRAFNLGHLVRPMTAEIRSTQGSGFIIFQGMQDHTADSVKGLEGIDIVWAEEAQNLSQRSLDLLLPTIRKAGSEIWFSWNPDQPENPVDQFFRSEAGAPEDSIVVSVNYTQNPLISEKAIALAETCRRQDMQAYLHIWMGEYNVKSDAQILNGKWVVDEFEPQAGWNGPYLGADFGFAQDPTTLVKCWIHDRKLYIERESYAIGLELDHTAQRWKLDIPGCENYVIQADSARPESISYLRRYGIPRIVGVEKWKGSVEDGIAHLRSYDKIIIHPRCKHMIEEARLYSYKVDRLTGNVLPTVVDSNNHCLVAGTQITTDKGDRPIESIKVGDRVLTRAGFKPVLWSGETGKDRQVFTVKTRSGRTFEATENHEVLTGRGFVRVDALRYNDRVLTLITPKRCQEENLRTSSGLSTKASHTLDIQAQRGGTIASITSQAGHIWQGVNGIFTGRSGLISTVRSQRATTFTTRIQTHSITASRTLSASTEVSTCLNMLLSGLLKTKRLNLLTSIASALLRLLGTDQRKAKNFTTNWLRTLAKSGVLRSRKGVTRAANLSSLTALQLDQDSAQTPANLNGEGMQSLITSSLLAQFAAAFPLRTNTPTPKLAADYVESVCLSQIAPIVYDLTIEDQHEFFANGVLVHNCVDSLRYSLVAVIKNSLPGKWGQSAASWG